MAPNAIRSKTTSAAGSPFFSSLPLAQHGLEWVHPPAPLAHPLDDGTGHLGDFVTDAPVATGSLALYLKDFGRWSGGLDVRYLGNYPLSSGPCVNSAAIHDFPGVATSCANAPTALGQVNGKGFAEVNLDARYAFSGGWSAALGIYNLFNTHAAAAEFWYVDRLQNEINSYPDGRADVQSDGSDQVDPGRGRVSEPNGYRTGGGLGGGGVSLPGWLIRHATVLARESELMPARDRRSS